MGKMSSWKVEREVNMWLTPVTLSRFVVFPSYAMVRRDRASSTKGQRVRGGRVAILHRNSIQCQVLKTPETRLLETPWLSVTWRGGRPAILGVIYRPPDGSVCQAVEELQEQLRPSSQHWTRSPNGALGGKCSCRHGRRHHYGHYGECPYKFWEAPKLVRNVRTSFDRFFF